MLKILLSPPIAFIIFLLLVSAAYVYIQRHTAKGLDHPEKYLPYSGGQKLPPKEVRLSYKTFFRLGLLFGIVHVAVLVLATVPLRADSLLIALLYVVGLSVSAFVLARSADDETEE